MSFKKFGTGEVTETEGTVSKTASSGEFTDADKAALQQENDAADKTDEEA